jgi:hypothetical protein
LPELGNFPLGEINNHGGAKQTMPPSTAGPADDPKGVIPKREPGRRQDKDGYATVWVYNRFTAGDPRAFAGRCTFWFKNLKTDEDEGEPEVIYREDAIVPRDSILVFEPSDQERCVSAFLVQLIITDAKKREERREFGRGDPGEGKCWTKAEFYCGKAK